MRVAFIELSLYSEKQNERLVGDHDSANDKQGSTRGFWRFLFFLSRTRLGTPTRRHALGRLPTPPPLPENLLSDCTENCPLRPLRAPTAHSEVQGDDRCNDRRRDQCNDRPIAALHFLPPTGDSRSGRRSFDSKLISLPPLDEVPVRRPPREGGHPASPPPPPVGAISKHAF